MHHSMRHSLLALTIMGLLAGCGQDASQSAQATDPQQQEASAQQQTESERLNAWFDVKYEEQLQQSPIQLTFLGRKERYGEIDDLTRAAEKRQLEWMSATVDELKSKFDYEQLSDEAKTSYDVWMFQYERAKDAAEFPHMDYVFDQMRGAHTFLPQILMNFHQVSTENDMEAFISRIEGVGTGIEQLLVRAKEQVEHGIRAPRFAYKQVIKEANGLIEGAPFDDSQEDSSLFENAKMKINQLVEAEEISAERAAELEQQAADALVNEFKPAYESDRLDGKRHRKYRRSCHRCGPV